MQPQILPNLFSDDMLWLFRMQISHTKNHPSCPEDRTTFFRKQCHRHPLFEVIHEYLETKVNEMNLFGEPVKRSYSFLSMYDDERSICPLHTDRPQCKYTVDLCIDFKTPWNIFISDQAYHLEKGDAVAYSGTDNPHYRNLIQPGNFCDLVFFHFVPTSFQGSLD
jgi:hypothetical protein